ncbi:MAG: transglutaminase domain-containing protein [Clostridia bacterium]|nr:transglutaminase domain-containing protein [Clostridia bacterium]
MFRKKEEVYSGLSFNLVDESTSKNQKSANSIVNFLSRFLIVFMLSAGGIFTFSSMMKIPQIDWINYVVIVISALVFTICYKVFKKHWLVLIISICSVLAAGIFMLSPVVTGFKILYDSVIKTIYETMLWTAPDPHIFYNEVYISNTTYCMAMLSVVITSLIAFFTVSNVQFVGVFIVTFPLFELGAAFGCVSEKIPFALLLSGWAATLALHISNRQKNSVKHKNADKTNNHRQFVYKDKSERFGGSSFVMAISVFLVFVIISGVLTSTGFARTDKLDTLRRNVRTTAIDIYDRITGFDHDATLKQGDLKVLGDRKPILRHHATLQTPQTAQPLYLKGYVGTVYEGDKWTVFDKSVYKDIENVKKHLTKDEFSLANITGDLLYTDFADRNLSVGDFRIYDLRRERDYVYAPSGIISSVSLTGYEDLYSKPNYKDDYSYSAYYNSVDYIAIPYTTYYQDKKFLNIWSDYANFVQNNYTLLPEGIDEIAKLSQELQGATLYDTVDNVRNFLSDNTQYSDKVQKLPDDTDFAKYFLFDKGVGYSAHYATASAVMLRTLGVPTRYVEGFYVPVDQIKEASGDAKQKTVEITDINSHAWIEMFDINYGWIPIEVTPGFYSGSFAQMMQQAQNNAENLIEGEQQEEEQQGELSDDEEITHVEEEMSDEEDEDQLIYEENNILKIITIAFLVLVGLAVVFAILLIIRRICILEKRKKIFNSSDYRKQVVVGFEMLKRILKFKKIKFEKTYTFDDFKQLILDNAENDDEIKNIDEIFSIYEKAMFSKLLISEEDAAVVLDFIDDYGYGLHQYLIVAERLKWAFIDVIS